MNRWQSLLGRLTICFQSLPILAYANGVDEIPEHKPPPCRSTHSVTITSPAPNDEFVFDVSPSGRLVVPLTAEVAPDDCADSDVHWTADDIEGSTKHFVSSDGAGSGATGDDLLLVYENLPQENSEFGEKTITASANGNAQSVTVRVFFTPEAKNHPTAAGDQQSTPNWFYYWAQTSAGGLNAWYEPVRISLGTGDPAQAQYDYTNDRVVLADRTYSSSCNPRPNGNESTGIDCYAELLRHETWHKKERWEWWGQMDPSTLPGTARRAYDMDGDLVPDSVERALEATRGCNVAWKWSCTGRPDDDKIDVEMNAYTEGWRWVPGNADEQDWSWCGRQWADISVCHAGKRW